MERRENSFCRCRCKISLDDSDAIGETRICTFYTLSMLFFDCIDRRIGIKRYLYGCILKYKSRAIFYQYLIRSSRAFREIRIASYSTKSIPIVIIPVCGRFLLYSRMGGMRLVLSRICFKITGSIIYTREHKECNKSLKPLHSLRVMPLARRMFHTFTKRTNV